MEQEKPASHETLSDEDFLYFKDKIFALAGIHLTAKKKDLVRTRLKSYIQKNEIKSLHAYRKILESAGDSSAEVQTFVNLLTTNKTDFFREKQHFDFLIESTIAAWERNKKKDIKVWCCAASTGEEPYTIAMVLDFFLPKEIDFRILATDIDTNVLSLARNGVYPISKYSEIPQPYQDAYVKKGTGTASGWFRIDDRLHSKISFKQHNLIENSYPGDEIFDLIFCRNVLIYFAPETIRELMDKLHKSLKGDGSLFIGHSESIQGTSHLFRSIKPAIYKKVGT